ncbi:hypothetical protein [Pseudoduganella chitinolytica]|uniref:DNA-binding protein n=1 Tax=Pseudoduganella chitinolytica TaxID=34070 RepID=A0ABY8BGL1_9BURK|nr:hypothetical protein [Pseudoduganella chitinolytica]WEF34493.1 hypothetical protein PX653_06925 [Pseudoduganella chitinolytica]
MASSFNIDSKLDSTLEDLKKHYGASSKAEVLRKAVALLNIVSRHEDADGSVTLRQGDNDMKIVLR